MKRWERDHPLNRLLGAVAWAEPACQTILLSPQLFNRKRDKNQSVPIKHDEGKAVTIRFPHYRLLVAAW
jgi:hypothetical protein